MADRRFPLSEIPAVLDAARAAGAWGPDVRAVVFHDVARLHADLVALGDAFPDDAVHAVAIKANPLVEVLRVVVAAGAGLEAASWEEVALASAAGCPPERIVFDSPAKTDDELRAALDLGVWLNADNEGELTRLERLGAPGRARIGLRVNPELGAGSIGITSTVTASSKFGVPLRDAAELVRRFGFVSGLHVHTGSQGVGLELIGAAVRAVSEVVAELDLDWLDVGGGLPVRYTAADPEPPTLEAWAAVVAATPSWGEHRLLTELGRWLQAPRGWAISRIEEVKEVAGVIHLVVHLGADMFLRRVYAGDSWDHDLVVLDPDGLPRPGAVPTSVAGPLCFSGDLLAVKRPLAPAQRGDLLLIRDVGAYTLSMWSRHCSRGLPATWGIRGTDLELLHPGESPDDVVSFWSRPSSADPEEATRTAN